MRPAHRPVRRDADLEPDRGRGAAPRGLGGAARRAPPCRRCATSRSDLRINPATVAKAYQRLTDAGVLTVRRGEGTYVADAPPAMSKAERARILSEAAGRYAESRVDARCRRGEEADRRRLRSRAGQKGDKLVTEPAPRRGSHRPVRTRDRLRGREPRRRARLGLRPARPQRRRQVVARALPARRAEGRPAGRALLFGADSWTTRRARHGADRRRPRGARRAARR